MTARVDRGYRIDGLLACCDRDCRSRRRADAERARRGSVFSTTNTGRPRRSRGNGLNERLGFLPASV